MVFHAERTAILSATGPTGLHLAHGLLAEVEWAPLDQAVDETLDCIAECS